MADSAPASAKSTVKLGEVTIEFGDIRNRNKMFPPTRERYRGHWLRQYMTSDEMTEALANMPDLPGMRLLFNPSEGRAVAFDPLLLPENENILRTAERVHKEVFHVDATAQKPVEYKDLDETDIKSWLYWMRRMVDNKDARIVTGTLPTLPEIARLAGKTQMEAWNSSARACKFREESDAHNESLLSMARRG